MKIGYRQMKELFHEENLFRIKPGFRCTEVRRTWQSDRLLTSQGTLNQAESRIESEARNHFNMHQSWNFMVTRKYMSHARYKRRRF